MSNESVISGLPGIVNDIRATSFEYITQDGVMKSLVTRQSGVGFQFVEPYFDPTIMSVSTGTEGTDFTTLTQITSTRRTYPAVEYLAQTFMTDKSVRESAESVKKYHSDSHGYAHASNLETKLLATLASGTTTVTATSATGLSWAKTAASKSLLRRVPKAAPAPFSMVLSEDQLYWFATGMTGNANYGPVGTLADSIQQKYAVTTLVGGVTVYTSAYFTASSGYQTGGMFSKAGIGLFMPSDSDYTLESQRDASKRGNELTSSMTFGARIRIPSYVVPIRAKSTQPS